MSSPQHPKPPSLIPDQYRVVVRFELAEDIVALLSRLLPDVGGNIPSRLATLETTVSQLSDAIAAAKKAMNDAVARVQSDVDALNTKIADLQAKVDAGGGTPQDLQDLADLKAIADALDPTKSDTLPSDTGTPTGGTPVPSSVAP